MNTTASSTPGTNDPDDLQRRGETLRADMDDTIEKLEERLSPRRAVDRSVEYLREHGGDISREVMGAVRRHPMPLLLSAVGLAWFAVATTRASRSSGDEFYSPSDGPSFEDDNFAEDEAGYSGDDGRMSQLRHQAHRVKDKARATVSHTLDAARQRTSHLGGTMHDVVREQPLALGALALAAGAILGATLPQSDYERRTVRPLRERAMASAERIGQRGYEKVRSALEPERQNQGDGGSTPSM